MFNIYLSFWLLDPSTVDATPQFFAYMGVAAALVFSNLGASYGTAKAGVGIASLGVIDSNKILKAIIPVVMAGILGIYGIIVAVLMVQKCATAKGGEGYKYLSAGLCCGLSSLASGLAIGVAGDAGVRAYAQTDAIYVGMILVLIFAEAIGLYGLIIAIIMSQSWRTIKSINKLFKEIIWKEPSKKTTLDESTVEEITTCKEKFSGLSHSYKFKGTLTVWLENERSLERWFPTPNTTQQVFSSVHAQVIAQRRCQLFVTIATQKALT